MYAGTGGSIVMSDGETQIIVDPCDQHYCAEVREGVRTGRSTCLLKRSPNGRHIACGGVIIDLPAV